MYLSEIFLLFYASERFVKKEKNLKKILSARQIKLNTRSNDLFSFSQRYQNIQILNCRRCDITNLCLCET